LEWLAQIGDEFGHLFKDRPIVLVDIGASGMPPQAWRDLAPLAVYVGFDPDLRELSENNAFGFSRFVMIDKAVSDTDDESVRFFLTESPFCSSVLAPNFDTLSEYGFTDLFRVERTVNVQATGLQQALEGIGLTHIDWLKIDSQGKDLDLFESLDSTVRERLLVLDIEPGVTDFYQGENTFAEAHASLQQQGFWLARAALQKHPRIAKATREQLDGRGIDFTLLPGNPTAVEAQYYRTRAHLATAGVDTRDAVCAWIIAMLNGDYGFAFDVAALVLNEPADVATAERLIALTTTAMEADPRVRALARRRGVSAMIPDGMRPLARKVQGLLGGDRDR
jgi:hypothetical protein